MQTTNIIQLKIKLSGLRHCSGLEVPIANFLRALQASLPISAARVVLEQRRDAAPDFRAYAHLAVPGPDIHAEARDCTLLAAWRKLAANLKKQFQQRAQRHELRIKGRGQCRTVASQWSRGA